MNVHVIQKLMLLLPISSALLKVEKYTQKYVQVQKISQT